MIDCKQKISEAILGHALGDAVGVPYEFTDHNIYKTRRATEMIGHGSHDKPTGTWSDDTSMTLCLIDALTKSSDKPDYELVMENFEAWLVHEEFTADNDVFDVGRTCFTAISNFTRQGYTPVECGPRGEYDCGNGALMRILPALFWVVRYYGLDFENNAKARRIIYDLTSLTHGHERCLIAGLTYLCIGSEILAGAKKNDACKRGIARAFAVIEKDDKLKPFLSDYEPLKAWNLADPKLDSIRSSGYVVETLIASVWAFMSTDCYRECILSAVNLGHDTDTVAAIAGGLAGMYYGIGGSAGIPLDWLQKLKRMSYIAELCDRFAERLTA